MAVNITLPEDVKEAVPGAKLNISYKLDKPLPIAKGTKFIIREAGKTVCIGDITSVTEDTQEDLKQSAKEPKKKKPGKSKASR